MEVWYTWLWRAYCKKKNTLKLTITLRIFFHHDLHELQRSAIGISVSCWIEYYKFDIYLKLLHSGCVLKERIFTTPCKSSSLHQNLWPFVHYFHNFQKRHSRLTLQFNKFVFSRFNVKKCFIRIYTRWPYCFEHILLNN